MLKCKDFDHKAIGCALPMTTKQGISGATIVARYGMSWKTVHCQSTVTKKDPEKTLISGSPMHRVIETLADGAL